jgi:hypothetical protein
MQQLIKIVSEIGDAFIAPSIIEQIYPWADGSRWMIIGQSHLHLNVTEEEARRVVAEIESHITERDRIVDSILKELNRTDAMLAKGS